MQHWTVLLYSDQVNQLSQVIKIHLKTDRILLIIIYNVWCQAYWLCISLKILIKCIFARKITTLFALDLWPNVVKCCGNPTIWSSKRMVCTVQFTNHSFRHTEPLLHQSNRPCSLVTFVWYINKFTSVCGYQYVCICNHYSSAKAFINSVLFKYTEIYVSSIFLLISALHVAFMCIIQILSKSFSFSYITKFMYIHVTLYFRWYWSITRVVFTIL